MIQKYFRTLFTPSVGLSALGLALLISSISFIYVWLNRTEQPTVGAPTAFLVYISGATSTPYPPTQTTTPDIPPTESGPETPLPGEIGIGSIVQITGTGGVALNIRSAPGLTSDVRFLGFDAEIFEVQDGPRQLDGFTWWFLVTPVDASRSGWAAAIYLSVVPIP